MLPPNTIEAIVPLSDLGANRLKVLIIGSGPAAVAVAEFLYNVYQHKELSIGIVERGGILSLTHFNNVFRDRDRRGEVIKHYGTFPWEGDFKDRGMLLFALGGRGTVAGAHLRRFYPEDMDLWPMGKWPISMQDLNRYFTMAELVRHVSPGEAESPAQTWIMGELDRFNPHPPPWGVDVRFKGRGFDSAAERLWELLHDDLLDARTTNGKRRLLVATNSVATKLEVKQGRATGVLCQDLRSPHSSPTVLESDIVVLAASPIESARLVLHSKLGGPDTELPAAGLYLAEHYLCRATISVRFPTQGLSGKCINVVIPPPLDRLEQRFQIDMQEVPHLRDADHLSLRMSGFAAMDPRPENKIQLLDGNPDWGVPKVSTTIKSTSDDDVRTAVMTAKMREIASKLDASIEDSHIEKHKFGMSNHEVGTLRMGVDHNNSVTDNIGKIHGVDNIFVADASVFPSIGVANPMLTITALAYRLAEQLAEKLSLQPKLSPSWSWYDRYKRP